MPEEPTADEAMPPEETGAAVVVVPGVEVDRDVPPGAASAGGPRRPPHTRSGRPLVVAHRGACGYRPEHTVEAYRLGLSLRSDALDTDVVATADGVLLVRHENELSVSTDVALRTEFVARRTTKEVDGRLLSGWFTEDFTWQELSRLRARERVPGLRSESAQLDDRLPLVRLADVFALAASAAGASGQPVPVMLELKSPTYFGSIGLPLPELLEQELRVAGLEPSADWLTVKSFEGTVLADVAARGLAARRVYLTHAYGAAYDLVARDGAGARTYAQELTPAGLTDLAARTCGTDGPGSGVVPVLDGVAVNKAVLLGDRRAGAHLVQSAHTVGFDVLCYSLRPENVFLASRHRLPGPALLGRWLQEFTEILDSGVDGVFADHPDLALQALQALQAQEPRGETGERSPGDVRRP